MKMKQDLDQNLQSLFKDANRELDGEQFTREVLVGTRRFRNRLLLAGGGVLLAMFAAVWLFSEPVQAFSLLVTRVLAVELVALGDGWLGWVLSPVNNVAGLVVLSVKLLRVAWKRIIRASFVY